MLDETGCTADMKQSLGSSTPTGPSDNKGNLMNVEVFERSVQFFQFIYKFYFFTSSPGCIA